MPKKPIELTTEERNYVHLIRTLRPSIFTCLTDGGQMANLQEAEELIKGCVLPLKEKNDLIRLLKDLSKESGLSQAIDLAIAALLEHWDNAPI